MPECKRCGRTRASADLRRSPTNGWLCLDRNICERDQRLGDRPLRVMELVCKLPETGERLDRAASAGDAIQALYQLNAMHSTLTELAMELATWAARIGKTQKEIAKALGVPASTLTGLKKSTT